MSSTPGVCKPIIRNHRNEKLLKSINDLTTIKADEDNNKDDTVFVK